MLNKYIYFILFYFFLFFLFIIIIISFSNVLTISMALCYIYRECVSTHTFASKVIHVGMDLRFYRRKKQLSIYIQYSLYVILVESL